MRLVISDTTALNYLILIGEIEVLPRLFSRLIVPSAVVQQLRHPRAPAAVSDWANQLPAWVEERTPTTLLDLSLGAGETEAIALAGEFAQTGVETEILTDDREAIMVAERRGFQTIGTLAVLVLADEAQLLDLDQAIGRLQATNFHLAEDVVARVRKRRAP
jgi:predicted nucleic acid-binding protein